MARDPATVTLGERHLIVTPLCFLDETGTLSRQANPFFAVAYDCRVGSGYVPSPSRHKTAFVQDLRGRLGVATLSQPFRNARVNIAFHGRTGTAARSQRKRPAIGRPPNASQ